MITVNRYTGARTMRVPSKDNAGKLHFNEITVKNRYFGSRKNGEVGKHNVIKSEVLILLDILDRCGFKKGLPPKILASRFSKASYGYLRANGAKLERFGLIKRTLTTFYGGQPVHFISIGGSKAQSFLISMPKYLKDRITTQLLESNADLKAILESRTKEETIQSAVIPEPVAQKPEPEPESKETPLIDGKYIEEIRFVGYSFNDKNFYADLAEDICKFKEYILPPTGAYCRNSQQARDIFDAIKKGTHKLMLNMYGDVELINLSQP